MQSFLEKTIRHLHEKYGADISDLCIILPNRRAGLFLKTHLSNTVKQHVWTPEVYAIEDFVELLAEVEIADSITLLFELYETVKTVTVGEVDSFDEFAKWGQVLLSDINEIDRYLVDAHQLFGNLKNIKELDSWSLNDEEGITDFQQKYLTFWKSLGAYYFDFKKRLLNKRQAYQGLAYEIVAKDVYSRVEKRPWKKIIFAGFNALNKAEEEIIAQLLNGGHAEIIWDYDTYYFNDNNQEAGKFLRKHNTSGKFKKGEDINYSFSESLLLKGTKEINLIGAAKNVAQAKVAGNLIAELRDSGANLQNTALVLADEQLLYPVLHSLPDSLQDVNITMGYPLLNTPISGYFELLLNLHINAIKLSRGAIKYSFYHRDFLNFLTNPYTATLLANEGGAKTVKRIAALMRKGNIMFVSQSFIHSLTDELGPTLQGLMKPLFTYWQSPTDALDCIAYTIDCLKDAIIGKPEGKSKHAVSLELEYLFAFTKITKRITTLMTTYPKSIGDLATLQSIFKQIVRSTSLPFYGEPLKGLQIMGMLETRTLDFENVILLSCNEKILPAGKSSNSFIPFDLKFYFGLPTYGDKDAIFSYHFYRLMQRASNVHLVYNTENDDLGQGEKSRFLTQLMHELPKANPNVTIREQLVNIPIKSGLNENSINVSKTEAIFEKLKAKAEKGFSPSLLNIYRKCSLQFYFKLLVKLDEEDEVTETIGADVLGDVVHGVLEDLYTPFIGKKLRKEDIEGMKVVVEKMTIEAFESSFNAKEISKGKNLLIVKVALKFLRNYLNSELANLKKYEEQKTPLIIHSLEEPLEAHLKIEGLDLKLHGKADRIDGVGSLVRIVDYKTGTVDDNELKLASITEELLNDKKYDKSFQLLMYAWMYHKKKPEVSGALLSGIISFRNLSAGLKTMKVNKESRLDKAMLMDFENQLTALFEAMFDKNSAFTQTTDVEACKYCSYKSICSR